MYYDEIPLEDYESASKLVLKSTYEYLRMGSKSYTKAQMLKYLNSIEEIPVLPVYILGSAEYFNHKQQYLQEIIQFSKGKKLIIRSSSTGEDTSEYSNAGGFESILNVEPVESAIADAVEKVYHSYHTDQNEEILVQPMLTEVLKSGVAFTADIDTYAPYDIISFTQSNDTAAVTSGSGEEIKTFIHYRNSGFPVVDKDIEKLICILRKLEVYLECTALDVEFAVTKEHTIYILQVRPIAKGRKEEFKRLELEQVLNKIYKKVEKLSRRHPFLLGETTYFGVMPDWNPAEILGIRPKKLAISLYKELITDNIWANQRRDYGYRDLTLHPLMVSFCGIPYIDTRITFNSFIPEKLNERIAEKLVNYYLGRLKEYPKYHDKIEFEIVFSCYYFGVSEELRILQEYGFNKNEIKRIEYSLLDLTNGIISPKTGLYKQDIQKIQVLEENYNRIMKSDISTVDKIYWLIEECKRYGTLPFAGVARAAFIAVQFLKSFVNYGIIQQSDYDSYLSSLFTVNKELSEDIYSLNQEIITKETFLKKYGHIRPGTYDIMSKRYDEDFEYYFQGKNNDKVVKNGNMFEFSNEIKERIAIELEEHGLLVTADELLQFIKESIEGREYLKFVFTKSVSRILALIEELGQRTGIAKEDMAYLDISVVKQLYTDLYSGNVSEIFWENIQANKKQQEYAMQLKLPSIIINPEQIYQYYLLEEEPNFITQKSVCSECIILDEENKNTDLQGKIVFIQVADPGYDYLFSKKIGGLVTQFGGANSHMAIRCAELGIPAVIGCGEQNFTEWKKYSKISLDCMKKQVIPLEL